MYCSRCGAMLTSGAAFCSACGQVVASIQSAQVSAGMPAVVPPGIPPVSAPPYGHQQYPYQRPPAPQFPYADFWPRVAAYLIDGLLAGVVIVLFFGVAFVFVGGVAYFQHLADELKEPNPVFPAVLFLGISCVLLAAFLGAWLYYALMESGPRQATLGKLALGLIVTDLQGRPISFGRASGRFFAKIVSRMIPLWIGFIMAAFTEKRQALHDMIASCLVLKK